MKFFTTILTLTFLHSVVMANDTITVTIKNPKFDKTLAYKTNKAIYYLDLNQVLKTIIEKKNNFKDTNSHTKKLDKHIKEIQTRQLQLDTIEIKVKKWHPYKKVLVTRMQSGELSIYDRRDKKLLDQIVIVYDRLTSHSSKILIYKDDLTHKLLYSTLIGRSVLSF